MEWDNKSAMKTEYFHISFIYNLQTSIWSHSWHSYFIIIIISIRSSFLASLLVLFYNFNYFLSSSQFLSSLRIALNFLFSIFSFFLFLIFSSTFFSFYSNLSKTRIFKNTMDDVKREADTLDSLTLNIKEIGSQVGHIILFCIILYHILLHYVILYYIALYYIKSYNIISYYIILHYITLYYIALYYIALYYITSYYLALFYIVLYYMI